MEGDVDSWGEGGTEEGASNGMSGRQVCVCVCQPGPWAPSPCNLASALVACKPILLHGLMLLVVLFEC